MLLFQNKQETKVYKQTAIELDLDFGWCNEINHSLDFDFGIGIIRIGFPVFYTQARDLTRTWMNFIIKLQIPFTENTLRAPDAVE